MLGFSDTKSVPYTGTSFAYSSFMEVDIPSRMYSFRPNTNSVKVGQGLRNLTLLFRYSCFYNAPFSRLKPTTAQDFV